MHVWSIVILSLTVHFASTNKANEYEDDLPSNCAAATPPTNGFYILKIPESGLKKFYAFCEVDPKGGRAWTRIQQNTDRSRIIFARNWNAYKYGFGDIGSDHFIGLEKLHALTNAVPHELWIRLEDNKHIEYNLNYALFEIGDETESYHLKTLGTYSGILRDLLRHQLDRKFCTFDQDCFSCAKRKGGGWWFKSCNGCSLNGSHKKNLSNIIWPKGTKERDNYKSSKMSIRPVY